MAVEPRRHEENRRHSGVTAVERERRQTILRGHEISFAGSRAPRSSTARSPRATKQSQPDFKKALEYGNPRTIQKYLPQIWDTLADEVRKNKCPAFKKKAVAGLGDVRVASLGDVVTSKVRIINDLSFDPTTVRGTKGGLNLDTVTQDIQRCQCGEALPKLSAKNINILNSES